MRCRNVARAPQFSSTRASDRFLECNDGKKFSKGLQWFFFYFFSFSWLLFVLFCFGLHPVASKNTPSLSLLALPEVQTNLTGSSLIAWSLRRGYAGLASPGPEEAFHKRGCLVTK